MTPAWSWRKSSRSAGSGECVEIGTSPGTPMVAIRDSKLGNRSPMLMFGLGEMAVFLREIKAGDGLT
jgi:Domain of unknown function (DUF397)